MHGWVSLDEKDIDGFETGSGEEKAELASLGCLTKARIELTCQALGQAGGSCP